VKDYVVNSALGQDAAAMANAAMQTNMGQAAYGAAQAFGNSVQGAVGGLSQIATGDLSGGLGTVGGVALAGVGGVASQAVGGLMSAYNYTTSWAPSWSSWSWPSMPNMSLPEGGILAAVGIYEMIINAR
jgi:hypothetical protein